MAGSYLYRNDTDAAKYVNGIYKTAIAKDIVTKFEIENEDLLLIGDYLMDNVGSRTSIRKATDNYHPLHTKQTIKQLVPIWDIFAKAFYFIL